MRNAPHAEAVRITRERERKRDARNLSPHAEAIAAMHLWGAEYAAQSGGSMDFWDGLSLGRQKICQELVDRIKQTESRAVFDGGRVSSPRYSGG